MTKEELKGRTKKFAVRIVLLARAMPRTMDSEIIAKQFCARQLAVRDQKPSSFPNSEMIAETNILPASKFGVTP
jgi:hypothetical protein